MTTGSSGGFCPWCGAAVPFGGAFCSECGRQVAEVAGFPSTSMPPPRPRWALAAIVGAAALLLIGGAVALTLLLGGQDGNPGALVPPTTARWTTTRPTVTVPRTTTTWAPTTTRAPTTTAAPTTTEAPRPAALICQVTDIGGIDDRSFNEMAWRGMELAREQLGVEIVYLESGAATDYRPNIEAFVYEGCDLIITVGFLLAADTVEAACDYPDQLFAIVDQNLADYDWGQCLPQRVRGLVFQVDEAAFLAGYLAAGMTQTGVVATFGGMPVPPVTIFMDGFVKGVRYYNEVNGTNVTALGWDPDTEDGLFVGNFESLIDGRAFGRSLNDEGADIILPVAGPAGVGTAMACLERGCLIIGPDTDWYLANPDTGAVTLTSIMKNVDAAVVNTINNVMTLDSVGNLYVGTLANGGVGLSPYHDLESLVPSELTAEIEDLRDDIIAAGGLAAFLGG